MFSAPDGAATAAFKEMTNLVRRNRHSDERMLSFLKTKQFRVLCSAADCRSYKVRCKRAGRRAGTTRLRGNQWTPAFDMLSNTRVYLRKPLVLTAAVDIATVEKGSTLLVAALQARVSVLRFGTNAGLRAFLQRGAVGPVLDVRLKW
jgi:hypothetical protein